MIAFGIADVIYGNGVNMIKNDLKIQSLIHGDIFEQLAKYKKIDISEAREYIANMSFSEYRDLLEFITPPSGQTIGPTGPTNAPTTNATQKIGSGNLSQNATPPMPTAGTPTPNTVNNWPGKGTTPTVGMTVGLKGPNGQPVPGQISQVDPQGKGVTVKNPTTGQEEWANMDALQPISSQNSGQQTGQVVPPSGMQQQTAEDANDLVRLRELAGIKENCSAGATSAGSIAVAPAAMGNMRKRQPTDEQLKKEYEPKEAAKTIVGDTKPNQASGELSSNLAVRGKKTASRTNNGFKR